MAGKAEFLPPACRASKALPAPVVFLKKVMAARERQSLGSGQPRGD